MFYLLKTTLPDGRTLVLESVRIDQTYRGVLEGGVSPETRAIVLDGVLKKLGGPERIHLIEPELTPLGKGFGPDDMRMPWYWVLIELTSNRPVSSMHGESCLSVLLFLDDPLDRAAIDSALSALDWERHARDCDLHDF